MKPDTYENAWGRPAGFAFSNVYDLSKFVAFLLDGNTAVMPDTLREEMQSPQVDTQQLLDLVHYGYGLQVLNGVFLGGPDKFHEMKVVQHGGDIPGFAANIYYVPSLRFGFVALSNADFAHYTQSFVTALLTLAPLPAPSPPPDLSADPETFAAFEGVYQDDFNVGEITVTKVGDDLEVSIPLVDDANIPYDPVLIPSSDRNFYLSIQGTYLPLTFIADASGTTRYLRTRSFVGIRPEIAPPPPPPSPPAPPLPPAERMARFRKALEHLRPTAVDRLIHPAR